jgi:hypothetical protein
MLGKAWSGVNHVFRVGKPAHASLIANLMFVCKGHLSAVVERLSGRTLKVKFVIGVFSRCDILECPRGHGTALAGSLASSTTFLVDWLWHGDYP